MKVDVFISHASEDKDAIARPLAMELRQLEYVVWFDEFELKVGDSILRKIDEGLRKCRFGIVILSPDFFKKEWPQKELDGMAALEDSRKTKVILPVWHKIGRKEVASFSPVLAGRLATSSDKGLAVVVADLRRVLDE